MVYHQCPFCARVVSMINVSVFTPCTCPEAVKEREQEERRQAEWRYQRAAESVRRRKRKR